jgi:hypothetical protein
MRRAGGRRKTQAPTQDAGPSPRGRTRARVPRNAPRYGDATFASFAFSGFFT